MSYAYHVECIYADGTRFTDPNGYLSPMRAASVAADFKRGGVGRRAIVRRVKVRDDKAM